MAVVCFFGFFSAFCVTGLPDTIHPPSRTAPATNGTNTPENLLFAFIIC
jgi:hypothetical protein